jgi:hypothetical protein
MKSFKFLFFNLVFLVLLCCSACTNDQLPEPAPVEGCETIMPTYDDDIKPIIDNSCAYSGCHLDGSAPGIYIDYEGLLPILESGFFRSRVIFDKDDPNIGMPPNYAPNDRPQDLTQEELDLITCWLDNGFPEN